MDERHDFLSTAQLLVAEAKSLGAVFSADGTWEVTAGHPPLPVALVDRLRVHRRAIAALHAEDAICKRRTQTNRLLVSP